MEENVELQRQLSGDESVPYGVALVNYATLLNNEGDNAEALDLYMTALAIYAKGYGTDSPRYAYLLENVAIVMTDLGRYEEAEDAYTESLAVLGKRFGSDHPEYAFTQRNWGIALGRMGRPDEAVPELRAAIDIWTASHGANYSKTVMARISLVEYLLNSDDVGAAISEATTALEAARDVFPETHQQRLMATRVAARAHRDRRNYAAAEPLYLESLAIAARLENNSMRETVKTEIEFARNLAAQGRRTEARQLLENRAAIPDALEDDMRSRISAALDTL